MSDVYGKFVLVPIETIHDLKDVNEGDWLYDSKISERRAYGRNLYDRIIKEKIGFVKVLVVDKTFYYGCKPLLLEPCGSDSYWTEFEFGRFFKLVAIKGSD